MVGVNNLFLAYAEINCAKSYQIPTSSSYRFERKRINTWKHKFSRPYVALKVNLLSAPLAAETKLDFA